MSFPFVEVDAALDPADGVFIEAAADDFVRGELVFDVEFEDGVEDFVGREGVLVFLFWAEFGAGWLVDGVPGDDFAVAVEPAGDFVDFDFG